MSLLSSILERLGLVVQGRPEVLDQTISALIGAGVDFTAIAYVLSAMTPSAPANQVLSGDQDFPCPISLAMPTATTSPAVGLTLDPIVAALLAANVDYSSIVSIIGILQPTAAPSLTLTGTEEFPDGVPISLPTADTEPEFGSAFEAAASALSNASTPIASVVDLLAATIPSAPPAVALIGQRDFPAIDIPIDMLVPEP